MTKTKMNVQLPVAPIHNSYRNHTTTHSHNYYGNPKISNPLIDGKTYILRGNVGFRGPLTPTGIAFLFLVVVLCAILILSFVKPRRTRYERILDLLDEEEGGGIELSQLDDYEVEDEEESRSLGLLDPIYQL